MLRNEISGDGTINRPVREGFADKPVADQISTTVKAADGKESQDEYIPFTQINKGYVYAVRVFDSMNDFYLLVRIDDIVRGEKIIISLKKVVGPQNN